MSTKFKLILTGSILFYLCVQSINLFAWNYTGHRVIAQIAYDDLTPMTRQKIRQLMKALPHTGTTERHFIEAAVWADDIRNQGVTAFNHWHFMNRPIIIDGVKPKSRQRYHIIWATQKCVQVLSSSKASIDAKAWFLRFYLHLVGDLHQPLHCVEFYSPRFPNGDHGGNRDLVKSSLGDNLHQVWDRGVGYFNRYRGKNRVRQLADQVKHRYPRSVLNEQLLNHPNPSQWAYEGYKIAKKFIYTTPLGMPLSPTYVAQGKVLAVKQLALAGYRLADNLNALFDSELNNQ